MLLNFYVAIPLTEFFSFRVFCIYIEIVLSQSFHDEMFSSFSYWDVYVEGNGGQNYE